MLKRSAAWLALGALQVLGAGAWLAADETSWRVRPRAHELRHPPWQLGVLAERVVGSDITDTRFGWRIPAASAVPIDGGPFD